MLSKCDVWLDVKNEAAKQSILRRDIIYQTYRHAVESGDKHVYFIDGATLFGRKNRHDCTVDRCHPNDLGFYRMYKHVLPVLKKGLQDAED